MWRRRRCRPAYADAVRLIITIAQSVDTEVESRSAAGGLAGNRRGRVQPLTVRAQIRASRLGARTERTAYPVSEVELVLLLVVRPARVAKAA